MRRLRRIGHQRRFEAGRLRDLWRRLDEEGEFDLARSPEYARVRETGFVSGRSTHDDRLRTIRSCDERYGTVIDPHTADGVKVGLERREAGVPLVCLETALPAKFAETIREALGHEPARPGGFADLESRPQRFEVMERDPQALKRYIERHAR